MRKNGLLTIIFFLSSTIKMIREKKKNLKVEEEKEELRVRGKRESETERERVNQQAKSIFLSIHYLDRF